MYLTPEQIDELKNEVTIHRVLNIFGKTTRINCVLPGHTHDKSKDMFIDPTGLYFYCHKCKKGGDVIRLIELTQQITRAQAIEYLVIHYSNRNFELDRENIYERNEVLSKVQKIYREELISNPDAQEYIKSRGWSLDFFIEFGGGYDSGKSLNEYIPLELLTKHSLVGGYKALRNTLERRIIFPYYNKEKLLIQLLGRSIDNKQDVPKILPLPCRGNQLFKFNHYLFNESILADSLKYVFICEGQTDTYTLIELGVNAVGISGNANLYKYVYKLKHVENIAVLLDSDQPTQEKLPEEILKLLQRIKYTGAKTKVYIVELPKLEGIKDVNDIKVKYGLTRNQVKEFKRIPASEFLMHCYAQDLSKHAALLPLLEDSDLDTFSAISGISLEALRYGKQISSPV